MASAVITFLALAGAPVGRTQHADESLRVHGAWFAGDLARLVLAKHGARISFTNSVEKSKKSARLKIVSQHIAVDTFGKPCFVTEEACMRPYCASWGKKKPAGRHTGALMAAVGHGIAEQPAIVRRGGQDLLWSFSRHLYFYMWPMPARWQKLRETLFCMHRTSESAGAGATACAHLACMQCTASQFQS